MHEMKPEQDNVAPSRDGVVSWCRKKAQEYFITPLLKSSHPPWFDARGVSLGLAVGFAVPVGGQVAFLGLLRAVFRFNFLAAVAFSFVSNPFNMIPLYYGYYRLGCWVTGMSPRIDFHLFRKLMHPITQSEYFWEALASFMALSKEILIAWTVTAAILASSSALIGYVVTYRVQVRRARRRAQRLEQQYEKIVEEFEDTHEKRPRL